MRTNNVIKIEEDSTKMFFSNRAKKYTEDNPYSVTMYQDKNPELVEQRNIAEMNKLVPLAKFDSESAVLDIGCGIGRWADEIKRREPNIVSYYGIDFSDELIRIANKRNDNPAYHFSVGGITDTTSLFSDMRFNRIIMIGVAVYINDDVLREGLEQIASISDEKCIIVFREPVGIEKRLSLKDFYSDELQEDYNAIYRTKNELMDYYEESLVKVGFSLVDSGPLFGEILNNRKETTQWFFCYSR